jgi:hypothetical protein
MRNLPFERSFASHIKSQYWSEKNEINPRDVCMSSKYVYWFNCPDCKHEFDSRLSNITYGGSWCSFCAIPSKRLCDNNECDSCFNKSLASHETSKFWSSKNDLTPRDVFKSSHNKYLFDCPDCLHVYDTTVASLTAGSWCPYCSSHRLCSDVACEPCKNKSFMSHPKAKFWSNKNEANQRDIFKSSGK